MVKQGIVLTLVVVLYCTVSYCHNYPGDIYGGGSSGFPGISDGGDPSIGVGVDPRLQFGGVASIGSTGGFSSGAGRWWCTCRHWWCRFGEWQVRNTCGLPFYPWWYKTCCKWLPWWQTISRFGGYSGYSGQDGFSGGMGSYPYSSNIGFPGFPGTGERPHFGKSY